MMRGQYDSFLFASPADNAVTAENFGMGNGSTVAFQLTRAYGVGGFTFAEPVQNLNGVPSIYVNGVLQASPLHQAPAFHLPGPDHFTTDAGSLWMPPSYRSSWPICGKRKRYH